MKIKELFLLDEIYFSKEINIIYSQFYLIFYHRGDSLVKIYILV